MKCSIRTVLAHGLVLAAGAAALAGPVDPPSGPVSSSFKTLAEVEPRTAINPTNTPGDSDSVFRISQPGSYYLTGDVNVPAGKRGIEIDADGVTIDLSGFTVSGVQGSLHGVCFSSSPRRRVVLRDGHVTGMGGNGVDLAGSGGDGSQAWDLVLENVTVTGSGSTGIRMLAGVLRGCQSYGNGGTGIYVYGVSASLASACIASGNSSTGITLGNGVIESCTARANGDAGITIGNSGVVRDCHSESNEWGFGVVSATISGCTATNNSAGGIYANARATIVGNYIVSTTLISGSVGIRLSYDASRVEDNNIVTQATGVQASGGNNFIVGNTFRYCSAAMNTVAGNRVGTLLIGASSAAINGNSGGGLGTTDPHANIVY